MRQACVVRTGMRVAPWDLRLAARTVALATVALGIVGLVEWITDERGVASPGSSGGRSIGLVPLVPLAGAVAVAIALAPARTSGEQRALAALGASPFRVRAPATFAAIALAAIAALFVISGRIDVSPLFPSSAPASDWHVEPGSNPPSFVSTRRHAQVDADDVLSHTEERQGERARSIDTSKRTSAAAIAIFGAGAALALWMSSPMRRKPLRTVVMGAVYGAAQVATFQSVGAGALPAIVTAIPPIALLLVAFLELRAERTLPENETWL